MLTYARQYRRQRTVRQRLCNFCINKNKMVAKPNQQRRSNVDKSFASRERFKEVTNWISKQSIWNIPTVLIVLETSVFNVSS